MFQEGHAFVALIGFVSEELCYALNMRLGISAIAKICIVVIWVTGTAQCDRWLPVFRRDMLPLCFLWFCFSLHTVEKVTDKQHTKAVTLRS